MFLCVVLTIIRYKARTGRGLSHITTNANRTPHRFWGFLNRPVDLKRRQFIYVGDLDYQDIRVGRLGARIARSGEWRW